MAKVAKAVPVPYTTTISTLYTASEKRDFETIKTNFLRKGVTVKFEDDSFSGNENSTSFHIEIESKNYEAETTIDRNSKATISKFKTPKCIITIKTVYKSGENPASNSAYGIGRRAEDVDKSLKYHESRHGQSFLNFLNTTPFPTFKGKIGMTEDEFTNAQTQFDTAILEYESKANDISLRAIDCVGDRTIDDHFHTHQCSSISITNPK
jgi:hypothetical protein